MKRACRLPQQNAATSISQKSSAINTLATPQNLSGTALQVIQLNEGTSIQNQNHYAKKITTINSHHVITTIEHNLYITFGNILGNIKHLPAIRSALDTYKE